MKRKLQALALAVAGLAAVGCMAGPWTAREAVDDWSAGVYSDDAYVGTVVYVFAWPIGTWGGMIVDAVVLNNVAWWGDDVWDGTGSTYDHKDAPNGANNSSKEHAITGM